MTLQAIFNLFAFQLPGAPPPWTDPPATKSSTYFQVLVLAGATILMVVSLLLALNRKKTFFLATDSTRIRRKERRIRRKIQNLIGDHDAMTASSATLSQRIADISLESSQPLKKLIQELYEIEKIRFEMK